MNDESALRFPCEFPIKIMGIATPEFRQNVISWVRRYVADTDIDEARVQVRNSQKGRYQSITVIIQAQSRAQLDMIYQELSTQPAVKMVL